MLFAVICRDKPGEGLARRQATRPAHLAFLQDLGDRVKCAGALLGAEEGDPVGSLLIVEAENLVAAKALVAADPYAGAIGSAARLCLSPNCVSRQIRRATP